MYVTGEMQLIRDGAVDRILDLHGSRITVSSILNQGTRFEFEIPARAA